MATQVSRIKSEILSPSSKPINPFSIESILKSEPPSPQSSTDTLEDSTTTDSDSTCSSSKPAPAPVLVNPQFAWLLYQAQLQQYWRYMLVNNLAQQKNASSAAPRKQVPVYKPVFMTASGKPVGHKISRTVLKMQNSSRGAKRHDVITPSTEKKIKQELEMKDNSLLSQKDRPLLTREEYDTKCSKALPILHNDYSLSSDSVLSNKTFLEMVDINKVLDLSVTDLNAIIDNSTFTDEERAYIRELRRKAMNKKAAEECRRRKKSEEQHLTEEYDSLMAKKKLLLSDKGRLEIEINGYKQSVGVLPPPEDAPSTPLKQEPMDLDSSAQHQLN